MTYADLRRTAKELDIKIYGKTKEKLEEEINLKKGGSNGVQGKEEEQRKEEEVTQEVVVSKTEVTTPDNSPTGIAKLLNAEFVDLHNNALTLRKAKIEASVNLKDKTTAQVVSSFRQMGF